MYRTLDAGKITETLETLARRIGERFPNSGLSRVSLELTTMAREATTKVTAIARPNIPIRSLVGAILLLGLGLIYWLASTSAIELDASTELTNIMQGLDSGTSLLIVLGNALYVGTLEGRWKREQSLKALHEFRSIVHVIDMHQLTKDPAAFEGPRTSSSPDREMTNFELLRYLDYCSELLSLASKVAALYADKLRDPVVIDAVGDIERLSNNLSQKIWQKINIIERQMHLEQSDKFGRSTPGPQGPVTPHPANTP